MKKILVLFVTLVIVVLSLSGCMVSSTTDGYTAMSMNFELICTHYHSVDTRFCTQYYRDIDTDIMYILSCNVDRTALSAYYDTDGKPMTYEAFNALHMKKYHE